MAAAVVLTLAAALTGKKKLMPFAWPASPGMCAGIAQPDESAAAPCCPLYASAGETNGKSNNLNNCLKNVIYKDYFPCDPQGPKIPKSEVMVVFDADMVAKPNFYTKILEVMLDDDCALCLTPQGFNNVDAQSDIFNNLNLSFWEYMLPGTDALGYIACTGTNFCLRCYPLADCGWFPVFTITEDYALGMMLKAKGYKAGYLNEYLAIGEAPEEPRNIFRQRSRWCKGQMQVCAGGCGSWASAGLEG
jgi:cellulose synthase/poly-beta-1,6-N-acetylglucosamine synthase-like glycosyltransferase